MGHKKKTTNVKEASANLTDALDKVPEMTEKKKKFPLIIQISFSRIDIHNNIATRILREIEKRELDQFFEIEY